jgi:Lrp/AsnC family leucine-responsive transcriptional regulator
MPDTPQTSVDGSDLEILEMLRRNARRTLADIAAQTGLSSAAVKRRIARLERLGVIRGYTTEVDHARLGRPIEAFTELRFAGDTRVADIKGVVSDLPEVQAIYTMAGDPDALVRIRVRDVGDLTRVIDLIRRRGKITGTKTMIVLDAETPQAPLAG